MPRHPYFYAPGLFFFKAMENTCREKMKGKSVKPDTKPGGFVWYGNPLYPRRSPIFTYTRSGE